jgi:hypothetical protein
MMNLHPFHEKNDEEKRVFLRHTTKLEGFLGSSRTQSNSVLCISKVQGCYISPYHAVRSIHMGGQPTTKESACGIISVLVLFLSLMVLHGWERPFITETLYHYILKEQTYYQ